MLRRMFYPAPNPYQAESAIALGGALILSVGFLAFLVNILMTLGWRNVVSLVIPERKPVPTADVAV